MRALGKRLLASPETGLLLVLVLLTVTFVLVAGSHPDRRTGEVVNNSWNSYTLIQTSRPVSTSR